MNATKTARFARSAASASARSDEALADDAAGTNDQRDGASSDPERLVQDHIGLLYRVATTVYHALGRSVDFDELVQFGSVGLLEAARRYDDTRGARFCTFAYYRIRGAMYDGIGETGPLPRSSYRRRRAAAARVRALRTADGVAGAGAAGESSEAGETARDAASGAVYEALREAAAMFIISFEMLDPDDSARHTMTDSPPDDNLLAEQLRGRLQSALAALPEQERALLELHYNDERSLQDAGAALGISKSWASRVHARALGRLRRSFDRHAA